VKPVTLGHGMMSPIGTKRTSMNEGAMSAFGGKADVALTLPRCLLLTQSGHRRRRKRPKAYREVVGGVVMSVTGLLGLCGAAGAVGTTVVTGDFSFVIDVGSGKPCG
jgi:hypothetical protein